MLSIILVQDFCPLKIKITQFPNGFRHNSFEPTCGWIQSIYRCCNFSQRAGTTTRPPVPRGMYEECKLSFLTDIDKCIKKHKIPPELNADQTPIKGLTDKRNITLTFVISLAGEFLPMQLIFF